MRPSKVDAGMRLHVLSEPMRLVTTRDSTAVGELRRRMAGARRVRRLLLVLAVGSVVSALSAASATAHAYLESSSPVAGAQEFRSPAEVLLRFDEPLNRQLSTAAIYDRRGGRVDAVAGAGQWLELALRPARPLPRGSYQVRWHSVSASDGHAEEGSFAFGVRTAPVGAVTVTQSGPPGGLGWLRAVIRAAMYAALFVFAGALMLRTLLSRRGETFWALPTAVRLELGGRGAADLERRERSLVLDTGLVALALAAAGVILDTQIAAGNLSGASINAFLLSNTPGLARVAVVALLVLALLATWKVPRAGLLFAILALGALAVSGHADSASPRTLAMAADWVHLLAGALWLGGIAVLASLWLPRLGGAGPGLRRSVMSQLLPRFGRVALPAFSLVVVTGFVNAYIQVRHPGFLWSSSYGRVLLLKSTLVGVIAALSYAHAFRLRPRLTASPQPGPTLERKHWRLIGWEPLVGVALAATVAVLVSYPAPEQVADARTPVAVARSACSPCVLPLPAGGELGVAEYSAPDVVAGWLHRREGRVEGQIRVLGLEGLPDATPFEVAGALAPSPPCGAGCRMFVIPHAVNALTVLLDRGAGKRKVTLPVRWRASEAARARSILDRAQAAMRKLRSVSESELVTSVSGVSALTRYTLQAPDRLAWSSSVLHVGERPRFEGAQIESGDRLWTRFSTDSGWRRESLHGALPFSLATWFAWSTNAEMVRLIAVEPRGRDEIATVALMDPGVPAWWTLRVNLSDSHVQSALLVTPGHSEASRFHSFNRAPAVRAPTSSHR